MYDSREAAFTLSRLSRSELNNLAGELRLEVVGSRETMELALVEFFERNVDPEDVHELVFGDGEVLFEERDAVGTASGSGTLDTEETLAEDDHSTEEEAGAPRRSPRRRNGRNVREKAKEKAKEAIYTVRRLSRGESRGIYKIARHLQPIFSSPIILILLGVLVEIGSSLYMHMSYTTHKGSTPFYTLGRNVDWQYTLPDFRVMSLAYWSSLAWGTLILTVLPAMAALIIHPGAPHQPFSPITWGIARLLIVRPSCPSSSAIHSMWGVFPTTTCQITAGLAVVYGVCDLIVHTPFRRRSLRA